MFYQLRDINDSVLPYLIGKNILNSNKTEIEEETKKGSDIINKREKLIQVPFEYINQTNEKKIIYISTFLVAQQKFKQLIIMQIQII